MATKHTFDLLVTIDATDADLSFELNSDIRTMAQQIANMGTEPTLTIFIDNDVSETICFDQEAA